MVARWQVRQGALKPPPKPTQEIVEWVQAQVAGWLWGLHEMYKDVLAKEGQDTSKHDKLIRAAKKYARRPLDHTNTKPVSHKVQLDLSGWNYPAPEDLPRELGVVLYLMGSEPFGAAQWMSFGDEEPPPSNIPTVGMLQIYAPAVPKLQDIATPRDLHKAMNRLETAVEHEARHLAQDLLMWATNVEQAGLPSGAKDRGENVDPFTEPEKYHVKPHEFHPLLDSMIREFKLKLKNVPFAHRTRKLQRLMDDEPMLKTLRRDNPDWWRRAIREITKQLT